jgi:small subunit ribosomal protein S6
MTIYTPDLDDSKVKSSLEKYLKVITQSKGTIDSQDIWGRRRLAYEINKKREGVYAVIEFTATSDATKELERQLGLSEDIMRIKILRKDK